MDKTILCRARTGTKGCIDKCLATSVMLLDCARLTHWRVEEQFNAMFEFRRDYMNWICLRTEPRETIGLFEEEWNHFDTLTPKTKMLHTTKRRTQPWKTGLPIDHRPREKYRLFGRYQRHPDPAQEQLFFGLLKECMENGLITETMIRHEMVHNHVRHDAFEVLDRTPPLALA